MFRRDKCSNSFLTCMVLLHLPGHATIDEPDDIGMVELLKKSDFIGEGLFNNFGTMCLVTLYFYGNEVTTLVSHVLSCVHF